MHVERSYYPTQTDEAISKLITRVSPRVIINTAALTDVALAECNSILAMAVNRDGVARLAQLAKEQNALLVHFSTDYVFDGSGDESWRESDEIGPLNVYGRSKWLGEQAIISSGCRYLIIRTSWLHSPWRKNFLKTMLQLGKSHGELSVVCDQIGAPTSATMLAEVTLLAVEQILVEPRLAGLYHVTASGKVSWCDYARFIFSEAKALGLIDYVPQVKPITSQNYSGNVTRPLNSQLDTQLFQHSFDLALPDWQQGVRSTLLALLKERNDGCFI